MTLNRFLEISIEEGIPAGIARELWDQIDFASNNDEDRLRQSHRKLLKDPAMVKELQAEAVQTRMQ